MCTNNSRCFSGDQTNTILRLTVILSPELVGFSRLLYTSYLQATGNSLVAEQPSDKFLAEALYRAPFVLLAHNTAEDPVFNYANMNAQLLWERYWNEFIRTPSRLSAEPVEQAQRKKMLDEAKQKGLLTSYEGVRISRSGKRFMIMNATIWNVVDDAGNYRGQATLFTEWEYLQ